MTTWNRNFTGGTPTFLSRDKLRGAGITCAVVAVWFLSGAIALPQIIPVQPNFWRLKAREDTDGDHKITIHDRTTPFELRDQSNSVVLTLTNVYPLSVAFQELKRADDRHRTEIPLNELPLHEPAVDRVHRLIQNVYWDALTRRIDAEHLDEVVHDSKVQSKDDFIYVPASDTNALRYFQNAAANANQHGRSPSLRVVALPSPEKITGDFVRALDGAHGILSLALETNQAGSIVGAPYVVPGGRFNELYCWDSYFIVQGLLQDGRKDLARGMADNLIYEMEYYGKIPNANRSYYLTRSQPPFLTSIIRAVFESGATDKPWLAHALRTAMSEYQSVWLGNERLVKIGDYELSRYYDNGAGPCPEVEPGHYDEKIEPWLALTRSADPDTTLTPFQFLNQYLYCGNFADLKSDGLTLGDFFKHDRAVRESGHDTTHRFDDRTADFLTVDLNALLYKYETDFADLITTTFNGKLPGLDSEQNDPAFWRRRAAQRKRAIMALLWDEQRGYFFDYDVANHRRSTYVSATGLYPLWAKMFDAGNSTELQRAKRAVSFACEHLEQSAGLAATAKASVESARNKDARQWDYPYGWAPHQMLAWQALANYKNNTDAARLAYRWLYTIAKNARDYNGTIPEKLNVVTGSHDVFVEYGNVGTKFSYIAPEGFGWMNASFEVGMNFLSPESKKALRDMKPPESPK
jgi:alpha,alpha-trehalase